MVKVPCICSAECWSSKTTEEFFRRLLRNQARTTQACSVCRPIPEPEAVTQTCWSPMRWLPTPLCSSCLEQCPFRAATTSLSYWAPLTLPLEARLAQGPTMSLQKLFVILHGYAGVRCLNDLSSCGQYEKHAKKISAMTVGAEHSGLNRQVTRRPTAPVLK